MRLILGWSLYIFSSWAWSDEAPDFIVTESTQSYVDVEDTDLKKQRYIGEDQPLEEQSILHNNFYQSERFRFYNNTQYSLDDVKGKYLNAQVSQVTLSDLSLSLGYGMEFQLSQNSLIGYEYLSSFPHDRGQSIRVFWKRTF